MADITVTFGGREVVLRKCGDRWESEHLSLCEHKRLGGTTFQWEAWCVINNEEISARGDSPQSAASAVESKLRQLRSELNGVLGDKS